MKNYPNGNKVTQNEIDKIKLLSSKGLSNKEIQDVTGWSAVTINRANRGHYDKKPVPKIETDSLKDLMAKNLETLIKIDELLRSCQA